MSVLIYGTQVSVTADGLASGNVSSTPGTSLELHAVRPRNYWWNVVQDTQLGGSDTGSSLVYDSMGNVYVYGLISTPNGNGTLALKFNPEGYLQWRKTYTDANGFACGGNDGIAIDANDNLYFMANDSTTNVFYAGTMDLDGNISPTYVSLTGGIATDIQVDNSGNMYLAGHIYIPYEQGLIAKVNSNNNLLVWTTTLDTGGANPFDAVATAWQGSNLLVSGTDFSQGTYLIQLDSGSGAIRWQQQVSTRTASESATAGAVSVDLTGNAYVLADYVNYGTAVLKVDVNGNSIWQTVLDGGGNSDYPTVGLDVIPDDQGHVYVLGITTGVVTGTTLANQLFITKMDSVTGAMLWSHAMNYTFFGTSESDYSGLRVGSIHEDRLGITGYINGPFPGIAFTAQVPTDGSLVGKWYGPIGSATYADVTVPWRANTYTQNYTFTASSLIPHYNQGNLTAGTLDLTTLAIPVANVVSITTTMGTVSDYQSTITLTGDGATSLPGDLSLGGTAPLGWISSMSNVYLGGSTHTSEFRYVLGDASGVYAMGDDSYDGDIPYMVKYDHNGAVLWQKQATYDGAQGITGKLIQAQPYGQGNLIVLGNGYNYGDGHEGVIVSLVSTADGSITEPLIILNDLNLDLVPTSIAVGPGAPGTGNVYVAGYFQTNSYNNAWLTNLTDQSSAGYGDFANNARFNSVTTDRSGSVYAGGQWYNGSSYEDVVIKTASDLGPPIWAVNILPLNNDGTNGAVMVDDSTNSLFVTTYYVGRPRLSKLDAATGEGIWTTVIGNISGGSEGGVLTPDGDVIVAGWAQGPWNGYGPEGMLFSRVSGVDGTVMWSNALYANTPLGGGNYFWNNNSSTVGLIGTTHFGAGGWQSLDGAEGAMAVKLPLDGTGQGTWGPYTYVSYAATGTPVSLTTTPRTVGITTQPVTFNYSTSAIAATVRANQFELDTLSGSGQQGQGNITNISRLSFATGGSINELVQGNVTLMNVNSAEFGSVSLNSWSPNGNQQAFSQLMWANTEIVTQSFAGFQQDAYNWVYTDSQGFHVENHPYGGQGAAYQWDFDNSGNFILPDLGNIVGGGNLRLQPDSGDSSAYLDIFLTTGPDIHIAGNSENVILGRDSGANVTVGVSGDVTIKADVGTPHVWTFSADGGLTFPTSGAGPTTEIYTPGDGSQYYIESYYAGGRGSGTYLQLDADNGAVILQANAGPSGTSIWTFSGDGNLTLPGSGNIVNNGNLWQFGSDGNLTLPASGTINWPDGSNALTSTSTGNFLFDSMALDGTAFDEIALMGTNSANILINADGLVMVLGGYESSGMMADATDVYVFNGDPTFDNGIPQPGVGQTWQFGSDGSLTLPSSGNIVNNGNTWSFGSNGQLTFPDATTQTTAYQVVKSAWNTQYPSVRMGNALFNIDNAGNPTVGAVSGTWTGGYTAVYQTAAGSYLALGTGSASATWSSVASYGFGVTFAAAGDQAIGYFSDDTNGQMYRATWIAGSSGPSTGYGYIQVEQLV